MAKVKFRPSGCAKPGRPQSFRILKKFIGFLNNFAEFYLMRKNFHSRLRLAVIALVVCLSLSCDPGLQSEETFSVASMMARCRPAAQPCGGTEKISMASLQEAASICCGLNLLAARESASRRCRGWFWWSSPDCQSGTFGSYDPFWNKYGGLYYGLITLCWIKQLIY